MMKDNALNIFFCYAHEDEIFLDQLHRHLTPLQRQGFITLWYDREISAGADWAKEIDERLNTAQIIILLISPDFMSSEYCSKVQMKRALERHKQEETYIVPVLLRSCLWESTSLAQFNILPKDHVPITESPDLEEAFCDVAKEVRYLVENLNINEWRDKGNKLYRYGKYKEALLFYEKILHLKNSTAASVDLVNVLNDLEAYEEALQVYDTYLQVAQTDRHAWKTKNSIDKHKYIEAVQFYESIFQQSVPRRSDVTEDLQLGMTQEDIPNTVSWSSLRELDQIIQRNPMNSFLYHLKGNILFMLKQYREALGAYEQAMQLQGVFDLTRQYLLATLEKISQQEFLKFSALARQDIQKAHQLRDMQKRDS